MRLEKQREAEVRRRRGATIRTIIQTIWLAITAVGAYFLLNYFIDQGTISYGPFYNAGIPRSVPEWVLLAAMILFIVIVFQFIFVFGYVIASPQGREKMNTPTAHSRSASDGLDE